MITSGMMSSNTPEWATPSDFFAELRGNKLPRVVDYDMVELSKFSFETWDAITGIKTKRTIQ